MFERMDAAIDRAGDRLVGIEMGGDVETGVFRLFDGRADLVARKAKRVDRIVGRGHAAVRHDLDETRATLDFLTRRLAHAVDPVGEAAKRATLSEKACDRPIAPAVPWPPVWLKAFPEMMRRGPSMRPSRWPDEAVVGTSGIAHRGEAAHEKRSQDARGAQGGERRGGHRVGGDIDQRGDHMHVAVDQPRHQSLPRKFDPRGAARRNRPVRDLLDAIVLDQHLEPLQERIAARVEQPAAGEEIGRRLRSSALVAFVHLSPDPLPPARTP